MPTKPTPKFTAWSYSRLKDYEQCPLKAKLKHLDKVKEPGSVAMENGNRVHKLAEGYVSGNIKTLPKELKNFKLEFTALKKKAKIVACEQQLAFTKLTWMPTSWFGAPAWVRVIIDAWYAEDDTATMIDYKTGKVRPENVDQLSLYAIAGFQEKKTVEVVNASLWYLDAGEEVPATFKRSELAGLKNGWEKRSLPMFKDESFKPKPSRLCGWCWYSKANDVKAERTVSLCQY